MTNLGREAEFEAEILHLIGNEDRYGRQRSWSIRWRDENGRRIRLLHKQTGTLEIGEFDLTAFLVTRARNGEPAPSWTFHKAGGEEIETSFLPDDGDPAFTWMAQIRTAPCVATRLAGVPVEVQVR